MRIFISLIKTVKKSILNLSTKTMNEDEKQITPIDIADINAIQQTAGEGTNVDDSKGNSGTTIETVGESEETTENSSVPNESQAEVRSVAEILKINTPMKKEDKKEETTEPKKPVKKEENTPSETKSNNTMLWLGALVLLIAAGLYMWQNYKKKQVEEQETIDTESEEA